MQIKTFLQKNIIALMICCLILTGCSSAALPLTSDEYNATEVSVSDNTTKTASATSMKVHFIDVGQGSSALIESNGRYMLVDGGNSAYSSKVVSYLKKQKVKVLDYVIATHYDADHLNGVVGALNAFKTKKVIGPDYTATSKVYKSFKSILKKKGLKKISPKVGKTYKIGKAKFTILAPNDSHYDDANDYSVAIKLVNGKNKFIITGDAEAESEYEMLENGINLSCDLYVAGHHGSKYSSTQAFLQAMKPKYVVISVGEGNSYGHPSEETMARLKAMGCKVYRTDEVGDIVVSSTGNKITFNCKASTTWAYGGTSGSSNVSDTSVTSTNGKFIGNVNSKKFHKKSCKYLPDQDNRVYFKSVKAAKKAGYSPCGICHPDK